MLRNCLSSSGSDRPCHSWSTSIFIIITSSKFGLPPFSVLLQNKSHTIGRKASQSIRGSISANLSPSFATLLYSLRSARNRLGIPWVIYLDEMLYSSPFVDWKRFFEILFSLTVFSHDSRKTFGFLASGSVLGHITGAYPA